MTYRSFQLDPSLPESRNGSEADHLARAKGLDPAQVRRMLVQVSAVAAGEGLRYDVDALVAAAGAGLAETTARAALSDPSLDAAVGEDIAAARRLGVSGVPFDVLDGQYGVSGAQSTEVFTRALEQAWAESGHRLVAPATGPERGPGGRPA